MGALWRTRCASVAKGRGLARPQFEGASLRSDVGLSIVEVVVATLILLVGALGMLAVVTTGLASTAQTNARDGATNLARDLVERARQVSYEKTSLTDAPKSLTDTLPTSDAVAAMTGSRYRITRRGVSYTVTIRACSIDDPSDGAGIGDATFCDAPTNTDPKPDPLALPSIGVKILGITVTGGGSLLDTVCKAIGTGNPIVAGVGSTVAGALSAVGGASIEVCPDKSYAAVDTNGADDLRRIRVSVSWDTRHKGSIVQTTLIVNPSQS